MTPRRTIAAISVTLLTGLTLVAAPAPPATAAGCSTSSTAASTVTSSSLRPVIFVHGWTSNGSALVDLGKTMTNGSQNRIQAFYFDYAAQSTTWAGNSLVSGCLADYVNSVSDAYRARGGDGKVLIVAHSMGGLAALYAANRTTHIAGVITLDTPFLGSPFGNTLAADALESYKELRGVNTPPAGSDAQVCLGQHARGTRLPAGCSSALPPYLATSVPIKEIAGDVTVRRTFGGVHLYDIDLASDGIVPTDSSHGYQNIQSRLPAGEKIELSTDSCTIDSDSLVVAAKAARWTRSAIAALAVGAAQIYADNSALDGLLDGRLTPGLVAYLGAATLAAECSHIHIYDDPAARSSVLKGIQSYLSQLAPPTTPQPGGGSGGGGTPPAGKSVTMAKGAAQSGFNGAPVGDGYFYAVTLKGFPANKTFTISCRDSKDPGGFDSYQVTTNGSGQATNNNCWSADGGDHWVNVDGIDSNRVSWASGVGPAKIQISVLSDGSYFMLATNFPRDQNVTFTCHVAPSDGSAATDFATISAVAGGKYGVVFRSSLCKAIQHGDQWVTAGSVVSNHVAW